MQNSRAIAFTLASVCSALALSSCAQKSAGSATKDYPTKAITVVVPFAAGGSTDVEARIIARGLAGRLDETVTVVNVPGGGSAVGLARVLSKAADGYTLFYESDGYLADLIARKKVETTLKDLKPVALMGGEAVGLFTKADAPYNTVPKLIAYAKNHPGKLTVAGTGAFGVMSDTEISFSHQAGINMKYVPTEGGGETVKNVLGGHMDLGIVTASVYDQYEKSGKLKTLAISAEGSSYAPKPGIPTFSSLGYKDTVFYSNRGFLVKAGTPDAIVNTLSKAILEVSTSEAWKKYAEANLIVSKPLGPEAFQKYLDEVMPRYQKVAGIG